MKVLLFGDIYGGKTTIVKELLLSNNFFYLSIDEIRKIGNEEKSQKKFKKELEFKKNMFIESTGFGEEERAIFNFCIHTNEKIFLIILRSELKIILERMQLNQKDVKFPNYKKELFKMIHSVHFKLEAGILLNKYSQLKNITLIQLNNNNINDKINNINIINFIIEKLG